MALRGKVTGSVGKGGASLPCVTVGEGKAAVAGVAVYLRDVASEVRKQLIVRGRRFGKARKGRQGNALS